jgi:hypothetical protein
MDRTPADSPPPGIFAEKFAWELVVLGLLPLLLLCFDRNWIFPSMIHDPWIYLGYALDPWRMLSKFQGGYYSERLTLLLPLAAAHALLPALTAHIVVHLSLYYVSSGSLYALVAAAIGRRTALLAALILGTHFFFLDAVSRDYSDGYGIGYFLAACWLLGHSIRAGDGRAAVATAAAGGALISALVVANLGYLVLSPFPVLTAMALGQPGSRIRWLSRFLPFFALGGVVLLAIVAAANSVFTGDLWFFRVSARFVGKLVVPPPSLLINGRFSGEHVDKSWIWSAVWLAFPAAVCALSFYHLLRSRRVARHDLLGADVLWPAEFVALALVFLAIECLTFAKLLQLWYYASMLIPLAMLAIAALIGPAVESMTLGGYRLTAVSAAVMLSAQAVVTIAAGVYGRLVAPFPIAFGIILLALGAMAISRRLSVILCSLGLLAAGMYLSRGTFFNERSVPVLELPSLVSWQSLERLGEEDKPPPYAQRMHMYDNCRLDAYAAVVAAARYVQAHDTRNEVLYWFDMFDPHAILFDKIACTRTRDLAVINYDFPLVCDRKTKRYQVVTGQLVAIPSSRPDVLQQARAGLGGIGFDGRLVGQQAFSHGKIKFWITLVRLKDQALEKNIGTNR